MKFSIRVLTFYIKRDVCSLDGIVFVHHGGLTEELFVVVLRFYEL